MSADVDDPVPSRNPGGEAIGTPSVGAIDKRSQPAHLLFSSPCLYSAMAFTTPTDDLNSPQASSSGSEGLYKEHEGSVLTAMHDEQALEHLLENLPDEKVLKRPFRCRLGTKQAAIPPFLDRRPSARSQLVALGKLAVVDAPPSPAATPISIDQIPQAPSPSIPERHLQDEHMGMDICREMVIPSDSLATDGYEHDTLPTDEPHTHVSSQERSSPDVSVPVTLNSTDTNEVSVANPCHVQEGGLEHDGRLHETVMEETDVAAEIGDGVVQHPTNTDLNVAEEVHAEEPPRTPEYVSSPPSPNADSQPSARSHHTRGRKRMPDPSTPKRNPKRPKKRSTSDRVDAVQEELLAKANQLMDDSVTVHDIIFVFERFALQRDYIATRGDADHRDQDEPQQQDPNRHLGLKKWWDGLGAHKNGERWEKCLQRVFAGLFYGQYADERDAFDKRKKKGNLPHPSEMYVDVCSPETIILDGKLPSEQAFAARAQAKRHFQNEVQKKKLWGEMQKRYGIAVFLLLNPTLQEDHVRRLRESNLGLLLDHIDERHPSLKQDIQGLSDHLSYYIDKGRLPTRKLRFEELSRSELESECFKGLSLSDMFKPLEPPAENAPCESPSGSHVEGHGDATEKVSAHAPPPPDQSRPASSSSSSLRDVDEPPTPRMDVDSRIDCLPDIFDTAADTPGSSPAGYSTYEGEFEHYHNQVMASRDPNYDFSSTVWQY
ncbi:hypothetical protein V499_02245 [Pseudogymnoascus sp. VKM F-103]|nr:hypothetical protein V499_02245 [Pseudogymnoascus sp. VKM F-103]